MNLSQRRSLLMFRSQKPEVSYWRAKMRRRVLLCVFIWKLHPTGGRQRSGRRWRRLYSVNGWKGKMRKRMDRKQQCAPAHFTVKHKEKMRQRSDTHKCNSLLVLSTKHSSLLPPVDRSCTTPLQLWIKEEPWRPRPRFHKNKVSLNFHFRKPVHFKKSVLKSDIHFPLKQQKLWSRCRLTGWRCWLLLDWSHTHTCKGKNNDLNINSGWHGRVVVAMVTVNNICQASENKDWESGHRGNTDLIAQPLGMCTTTSHYQHGTVVMETGN